MAIQDVEYEALTRARNASYERVGSTTVFTTELLLAMHRDWLRDIYPFAGQYRQVDVTAPAQGTVSEFRFSHAAYISQNMEAFANDMLVRFTPCRASSVENLAAILAEVHAEFIAIHPFREGNGRMGRWITELMALQADFPAPDHGFADRDGPLLRQEYYEAMSLALHRKEYGSLTLHFEDAIRRGERSFRP